MNRNQDYLDYREKYNSFIYKSYSIKEDKEKINIDYVFEIPGLAMFRPHLDILKKNFTLRDDLNSNLVKNMVFNIGMVELISYWKCACPPNVIIKCGTLDDEQIAFWKKLYFHGLSELFYRNEIKNTIDDFMNITSEGKEKLSEKIIYDDNDFSGYIVPIGGGKDSCVTLETLKLNKKNDYCLIINPKPVTLDCANIAGFSRDNVIEIHRTIDSELIKLNSEGFINGHTPFSAMLSFVSYLVRIFDV